MSSTKLSHSTDQRPELVFALVGAAGTRLDDLEIRLKNELATFGYKTVDIRLSKLLENFTGRTAQRGASEYDRIMHYQDMGDKFRRDFQRGDALALASIAEIRAERAKISGSPDDFAPAHAYILHQLKHPHEVDLLRKVYRSCFLLIAGHAPQDLRIKKLEEQMALKAGLPGKGTTFKSEATKVILRDEKEDNDDYGQNVRDAFPKADFFSNLGIYSGEWAVGRFVNLIFGHPFCTPSPDEYAMYQACTVSLRSSDNNRQVGAVIVNLSRDEKERSKNTDIIANGMNEVPRRGGGFYWDQDTPDNRDQALLRSGEDRASEIKISALTELIDKIIQKKWLQKGVAASVSRDLAGELLKDLKGTQFLNIGEFSRPVHAEMAALIDAARRGVAVDGHSMYVTTFPCHNCVKHIIAAGIRRVIYLEPYPKSRADYLYGEEINLQSVDGKDDGSGKVTFVSFTGIAPRKYQQLFSMSDRGSKSGNTIEKWEDQKAQHLLSPLYVPKNASLLYLEAERQALKSLTPDIYHIPK